MRIQFGWSSSAAAGAPGANNKMIDIAETNQLKAFLTVGRINGGFMFFHAEIAHALCVRGDLLVELYQVVFG